MRREQIAGMRIMLGLALAGWAVVAVVGCQSLSGGTKGRVYYAVSIAPDGTVTQDHGINVRSNPGVFGGRISDPIQEPTLEVLRENGGVTVTLGLDQMFTDSDTVEQGNNFVEAWKDAQPTIIELIGALKAYLAAAGGVTP